MLRKNGKNERGRGEGGRGEGRKEDAGILSFWSSRQTLSGTWPNSLLYIIT